MKDLFFDGNTMIKEKDLFLIENGGEVLSRTRNILSIVLGEYIYNIDLGFKFFDFMGESVNQTFYLESQIKAKLASFNIKLDSIYFTMLSNRTIKVSLEINGESKEVDYDIL